MRLSTIALSFIALSVAAVAASTEQQGDVAAPVARDFERKLQVRDPRKHSKSRSAKTISNGMLTWYGGGQLDNPACGGKRPSNSDHVVAVKQGGMFKCHDQVHITHKGKTMTAKVVDYCGGCGDNHLDLTQGLFKEFESLSAGEIHGVTLKLAS